METKMTAMGYNACAGLCAAVVAVGAFATRVAAADDGPRSDARTRILVAQNTPTRAPKPGATVQQQPPAAPPGAYPQQPYPPQQQPYPPQQGTYPQQQQPYPPQQGTYPQQQQPYPPQQGAYPQQQRPQQGAYPQQQQPYPPQQGAYPQQQQPYPPQQGTYPQQQPYPPQQGAYPQQQQPYPPQQGAYPQQQPYPPQQGAYPQQQQPYPPQQGAYPQPYPGEPGGEPDPGPTGVEVGVRLGFGLPFGNASGDSPDISKQASNLIIPVYLDVGYRFIPQLMAGAYFMYGIVSTGDEYAPTPLKCGSNGIGCSSHDTRLGIQLNYHPIPASKWDPWLGLGFGYEWAGGTVNGSNGSIDMGEKGLEYISFQGGVDFRIPKVPDLGIGPFVTLSVGQYDHGDMKIRVKDQGDQDQSADISNKALHEYLILGIRGVYDIRL